MGLVVALGILIAPAFSLAQNTGITVLSPNGGEVIKIGEIYEKTFPIKWEAPASVSTVDIRLDTGIRCVMAPCPASITIATGVKNTGNYEWYLDPKVSYGPGINFKVQVSDPNSNTYDSSDKAFSIINQPEESKMPVVIEGPIVTKNVSELQGVLKPAGMSIRQWGTHTLFVQPNSIQPSGQVGITYSVKASDDGVLNLLKKYEGQRVIIYGKSEYAQIEGGFWTIVAEKVVPSAVTEEPKIGGSGGSFIITPANGICPERYLVSENGKECLKLSFGTATAIAPKEGIKEGETRVSYSPILPVNGACPEGYILGNDDKECLKPPMVMPSITIAPMEGFKEVIFESEGKITIKDGNTNKETKIAPKEGFKATVSIESRVENQAPTVSEISVQSSAVSNETSITAGQVSASTKEPIEVKDNKVFLKQTEIKIMPDTASESAITKLGDLGFKIELKDVGNAENAKPSYEAVGTQDVKIFGLFNAKMKVSANVDAQTGEVSELSRPWWSFLVK